MALGSKNRKRSTPGARTPWFLGFGFHKITIEDFDIRTYDGKNEGDPETVMLTLKGRGESIDGFSGHEGADYQKVSFKPFFSIVEDMDGLLKIGEMDEAGQDLPEKGDALWKQHLTYKAFTTMALICDAMGVGEQYDAIDELTVYESLKKTCELLESTDAYAWFAFTEKDSKNPKTGDKYTNIGLNWDMVYGSHEIESVVLSDDGATYDVQPVGASPFTYEKSKYTYLKLESEPNDAPAGTGTTPSMPNTMGNAMPNMNSMPTMPGGAPAGMVEGDLPF